MSPPSPMLRLDTAPRARACPLVRRLISRRPGRVARAGYPMPMGTPNMTPDDVAVPRVVGPLGGARFPRHFGARHLARALMRNRALRIQLPIVVIDSGLALRALRCALGHRRWPMSDLIALSSTLHPSLHRRGCQGDRRVSLVKIRSMKIRRTLTRPFAYASLPVALRCRTDAAGRRERREKKNALSHELCGAESIAMRRPAFPYPSYCRCRTELGTGRQEVTL